MRDFLKIFFLAIVLFAFQISVSQGNPNEKKAYHWYFGKKAGLDFSGGNPVVDLNGQMEQYETGSVISDSVGSLLFYTDGDTVWNRNHQVMPNGDGLSNCESATNGGIIIKKPGSFLLYYIIQNDCAENNGMNGVYYSIVDMSANGGLGDVISKNNLLYAPSTEKIAVTYHCNGVDIWILGQLRNSNTFCAYLVTSSGINSSSVNSSVGYAHSDDSIFSAGNLKFSPNGNKLAAVYTFYPNGVEELFDFDTSTGLVSNYLNLIADTSEYGISFSGDNSKLYIVSGGGGQVENKIIQYDISSNNGPSIVSSRAIISKTPGNWSNPILSLELAPNGKIYGTRYDLDSLSVINTPNSAGSACNYNRSGISLNGRRALECLPQLLQNYFNSDTSTVCSTAINNLENSDAVDVYPSPAIAYLCIRANSKIRNVKLVDSFGIESNLEFSFNNHIYICNLEKEKAGIYLLQIHLSESFIQKKIIIER